MSVATFGHRFLLSVKPGRNTFATYMYYSTVPYVLFSYTSINSYNDTIRVLNFFARFLMSNVLDIVTVK